MKIKNSIIIHKILRKILMFPFWSFFLILLPNVRYYDLQGFAKRKISLDYFHSIFKLIARYNSSKNPIIKKVFINPLDLLLELDINEYIQCSYYFKPYAHRELIEIIKEGGGGDIY